MTPDQITLVRQSFWRIQPMRHSFALAFYERLVTLDSAAGALFRGDIRNHAGQLMVALHTVVRALEDFEPQLDRLAELGRRYAALGVTERHYVLIARALLWTLRDTLRAEFTPAVKAAWVATYEALVAAVIKRINENEARRRRAQGGASAPRPVSPDPWAGTAV